MTNIVTFWCDKLSGHFLVRLKLPRGSFSLVHVAPRITRHVSKNGVDQSEIAMWHVGAEQMPDIF